MPTTVVRGVGTEVKAVWLVAVVYHFKVLPVEGVAVSGEATAPLQ